MSDNGCNTPQSGPLKRFCRCIKTVIGLCGDETDPQSGLPKRMGCPMKLLLGVCYAILAVVLVYVVYCLWPPTDGDGNILSPAMVCLFRYHFEATSQMRLILLVAAVGALGSYIHAAHRSPTTPGTAVCFDHGPGGTSSASPLAPLSLCSSTL